MSESDGALPSLPRRCLQVLVAPGRLFEELRERPAWAGALILGGSLVAVALVLVPAEVWERVAREGIEAMGTDAPPDVDVGGAVARTFAVVGGTIGWLAWVFFVAGALTLVFRLLLGGEGTFRQYLAAAAHAFLIAALGAVLTVPLKILHQDPEASLSVGTFALFLEEGYPLRFLSQLDLFSLWSYLVLAVAVARIEPEWRWGGAAGVIVGFWVAFVAVLALIPAP